MESDDESDDREHRNGKYNYSPQHDEVLGKRDPPRDNAPPKKAFENRNDQDKRKSPSTANTSGLPPPPPPPRDNKHKGKPEWDKRRQGQSSHHHERPVSYEERKNCVVVKNIPSHYNVVNHLTKYFQRFGDISNVLTKVSEKMAIITYKHEEDAVKAFECKEVLFNQSSIELVNNGKVHRYEDDIKQAREQRKVREEQDRERRELSDVKKGLQQRLTDMLTAHMTLRSIVPDATMKAKLKEGMDDIQAQLKVIKSAEDVKDLPSGDHTAINTCLRVTTLDGHKPELKQVSEVCKVGWSSN